MVKRTTKQSRRINKINNKIVKAMMADMINKMRKYKESQEKMTDIELIRDISSITNEEKIQMMLAVLRHYGTKVNDIEGVQITLDDVNTIYHTYEEKVRVIRNRVNEFKECLYRRNKFRELNELVDGL